MSYQASLGSIPMILLKEKGFLTKPQPINRKKKVKFVKPRSLDIADEALAKKAQGVGNFDFLAKRVLEWQQEATQASARD
jgi:hypothetical protein